MARRRTQCEVRKKALHCNGGERGVVAVAPIMTSRPGGPSKVLRTLKSLKSVPREVAAPIYYLLVRVFAFGSTITWILYYFAPCIQKNAI